MIASPLNPGQTLKCLRCVAMLQVVQSLIKLGIVVPTSDLLPVRRSIAYFLDNFERQTREQETIGVRLHLVCLPSYFSQQDLCWTGAMRAHALWLLCVCIPMLKVCDPDPDPDPDPDS